MWSAISQSWKLNAGLHNLVHNINMNLYSVKQLQALLHIHKINNNYEEKWENIQMLKLTWSKCKQHYAMVQILNAVTRKQRETFISWRITVWKNEFNPFLKLGDHILPFSISTANCSMMSLEHKEILSLC